MSDDSIRDYIDREIRRLDRRIDGMRERIDDVDTVTEADATPLRFIGAVATLVAAVAAFITPIVAVLMQ